MRDAQAIIRDPLLAGDPYGVSGIADQSHSSVKHRKESRHKGCTELDRSRKRRKREPGTVKNEKRA